MATEAHDRWVQVDGARIHYLAAGETGPPLVLLHGGGVDSAMLSYGSALEPLSAGFRVFAPDWPGFGESDRPEVEYSVEFYVGFLERWMNALGLERASLVGLSLGGAVSLGFALRWPDRVDRLVLVNSYGLSPEVPGGLFSYLFVHTPLVNELSWGLLGANPWMVRKSLEGIIHDPASITEELVEEVYRMMTRPGAGAAWRSFQQNEVLWNGSRTSFLGQLDRLAAPTLILHGQQDNAVRVAWAERAHQSIPESELRVIPQCGHWLPREKPEEFLRALREFLEGLE